MAILPFTASLKKVVTKVAGRPPITIFNDKRVTFERRYKLAGIRDLSPKQVQKIEKKLAKRHPDVRFEVKNVDTSKGKWPSHTFFTGLIVKVL